MKVELSFGQVYMMGKLINRHIDTLEKELEDFDFGFVKGTKTVIKENIKIDKAILKQLKIKREKQHE